MLEKLKDLNQDIEIESDLIYSHEQKQKALDLIKYYADWFYHPVDLELENQLYFLNLDDKTAEQLHYKQLKEEYIKTKAKCGISKI